MTIISATYIGEGNNNGDYKYGDTYKLRVNNTINTISVQRPNGTGVIIYGRFVYFFDDWTNIQVLDNYGEPIEIF